MQEICEHLQAALGQGYVVGQISPHVTLSVLIRHGLGVTFCRTKIYFDTALRESVLFGGLRLDDLQGSSYATAHVVCCERQLQGWWAQRAMPCMLGEGTASHGAGPESLVLPTASIKSGLDARGSRNGRE